jgi:O-antigen ligase
VIRLLLLTAFVSGVAVFAFRDWYKALCGLIILIAVVEHPDMPKNVFGVQGLNPWNILLLVVVCAWAISRSEEDLHWDMPGRVTAGLIAYLIIVLVGIARLVADMNHMGDMAMALGVEPPSWLNLISEHLINSLKWVIPGLLLFDGCRSSERFYWGFFTVLSVYFLIGLQVIRWMPLESALSGGELTARSLKVLLNEVGYHRVNLSMMLAGAMWAVLASSYLTQNTGLKITLLCASATILFAQALTGGRTGYGTWAIVGLFLCLFRFKKYLLIIPLAVLLISSFAPGVYERMTQGFSSNAADSIDSDSKEFMDDEPDLYKITAGRNVAWPHVIEKIEESPFIGYGRLAMNRTGISWLLWSEFGESFPHPHNAYLELILDNGVIGAIPVLFFYLIIIKYSISLLTDSRSRFFVAAGGATLSLVIALLVASVGSQTFYPREGAVGMWCMIGLMLRVYAQREAAENGNDDEETMTIFLRQHEQGNETVEHAVI